MAFGSYRDVTDFIAGPSVSTERKVSFRVVGAGSDIVSALDGVDVLFAINPPPLESVFWERLRSEQKQLVLVRGARQEIQRLSQFLGAASRLGWWEEIRRIQALIFDFSAYPWWHYCAWRPVNKALALTDGGIAYVLCPVGEWQNLRILETAYRVTAQRTSGLSDKARILVEGLVSHLPEGSAQGAARDIASACFPGIRGGHGPLFDENGPLEALAHIFLDREDSLTMPERSLVIQLLCNLGTVFTHSGRADLMLKLLRSSGLPEQLLQEAPRIDDTQLVRPEASTWKIGTFTEDAFGQLRDTLSDTYLRLKYRVPAEIIIACFDMGANQFDPARLGEVGTRLYKELLFDEVELEGRTKHYDTNAQALAGCLFQIYSGGGRVHANQDWLTMAARFAYHHHGFATPGNEYRSYNYMIQSALERAVLRAKREDAIVPEGFLRLVQAQVARVPEREPAEADIYDVLHISLAAAVEAVFFTGGSGEIHSLLESKPLTPEFIADICEHKKEIPNFLGEYAYQLLVAYWAVYLAARGKPAAALGPWLTAYTGENVLRIDELARMDSNVAGATTKCQILNIVGLKSLLCWHALQLCAGKTDDARETGGHCVRSLDCLAPLLPDALYQSLKEHFQMQTHEDGALRAALYWCLRLPY